MSVLRGLCLLSNISAKTGDFFVILLSNFVVCGFEVVKGLTDEVEFCYLCSDFVFEFISLGTNNVHFTDKKIMFLTNDIKGFVETSLVMLRRRPRLGRWAGWL
jgi:hypothetical protein